MDKAPTITSSLRLIPAAELHAETLAEDAPTPSESRDEASSDPFAGDAAAAIIRNNQHTIDDVTRQALTMNDIEELKASGTGREIIAKIMASHSHLSEKTAYSLAKYSLRKQKKYMKRFTLLPMDVDFLAHWYLHEKEAPKILELREETLGLVMSWANVQCGSSALPQHPSGKWLVVDDTAGLLVAALAERMGVLHPLAAGASETADGSGPANEQPVSPSHDEDAAPAANNLSKGQKPKRQSTKYPDPVSSNSITLVHSATQPNVSLLSYFSYDPNNTAETLAASTHPLQTHLKCLTWLQLLNPELDVTYQEPHVVPPAEMQKMKSGKRGAYHRKRRRWAQCKAIVDETRAGDFDGLVIATSMELADVLNDLLPLVRGGAPIVIYNSGIEPLSEVMDAYSSGRKTAFLTALEDGEEIDMPSDDFPVDPRSILAPTLQTARAREWQVLPGRTHPVMTTRGGSEGYVFTGTRVVPAEGRVEARGKFMKKRKKVDGETATTPLVNGASIAK